MLTEGDIGIEEFSENLEITCTQCGQHHGDGRFIVYKHENNSTQYLARRVSCCRQFYCVEVFSRDDQAFGAINGVIDSIKLNRSTFVLDWVGEELYTPLQ